jgi:beta-lactamase regulating signal transducer with metallopeptidase domain
MISPYLIRLLCLSFATFFLVYLALGLASFAAAPVAIGLANRTRPRVAARLLLTLRLAPLAAALFVVLGLCLPSYLLLEPEANAERIGLACLATAVAGAAVWAISIVRGLRALAVSLRDLHRCRRAGRPLHLPGEALQVFMIEGEAPLLALGGLFHPRIVVSRGIVRALSPEQFDAALGHEWAHWVSRDNLNRLLLLLAPDPFPFFRGLDRLDRNWAKFAEWAADDQAVGGDAKRSLSLAAALVRVARMGKPPRPAPLMATLATGGDDLSVRVDRLLCPEPVRVMPHAHMRALAGGATLAAIALLTALMLQPATLYSVHRLLEYLVH